MSITFAVSPVKPAPKRLPARSWESEVPRLLHRPVEGLSSCARTLVSADTTHALVKAAHDAFYKHHPLVLSPDAVWFTIAQGFAHHVNRNGEELRARFVSHEGKKKLVVERRDFILGQPNPWPEAFEDFSTQIAAHVGKLRDLVVADFSTTGPVERAATEVLLMDTFQGYFDYEMLCGCGIPSITLTGTAGDWRSVRTRAAMLSEFGLAHWTDALLPVLDRVIATAEGDPDTEFWRSFFRYESTSVGVGSNGWINCLFPYVARDYEAAREALVLGPNEHLAHWEAALREASRPERARGWEPSALGPTLEAFPSSLASAPVNFIDVRTNAQHPLRFVAGLFGVSQDRRTGALAPEFGWAVVHDEKSAGQK